MSSFLNPKQPTPLPAKKQALLFSAIRHYADFLSEMRDYCAGRKFLPKKCGSDDASPYNFLY